MLAKDIMTTNVITVTPDVSVEEIAQLLMNNGISAVPVVNSGGDLVGLVSEGDLMRRRENETEGRHAWWLNLLGSAQERAEDYIKTHGRRAEDVMTRKVVTVGENTSVGEIAQLLERRHIKRVPVVRDGKIVGLVSRANLLHGLATHKDSISVSTSPDDRAIRAAAQALVASEAWISHGSLNTMVADGVVDLWGWVETESERKALLIAIGEIEGVKEVIDHLGILPPYLSGS